MDGSSSDRTLDLAEHVEALYPLARVLAAPERAASLVRAVYEHAATVPPERRPGNKRGWLFQLMISAHEGTLHPAGAQIHPKHETSFTNDPFREEVAEQVVHRMLPVALAACSIQERFILAIDVLGNPSDKALAVALDTSTTNARSIRDRARSALRTALRDVLSEPERMLVDVGLSDEMLRDHLQILLIDRLDSPSEELHQSVAEILVSGRETSADRGSTSASTWDRLQDSVPDAISMKGVVGTVLLLLMLVIGIQNVASLRSTAPSTESASVIEFAVQHRNAIREPRTVTSPARASAIIQSTWNRRVSTPTIDGASLHAVGQVPVSNGSLVPVLIYEDSDGRTPLHAFAFNYALLDQSDDQITLARGLRSKLATEPSILVEETGDQAVAMWRHRDDIFVLVAPGTSANALRPRIQR